MTSDDTYSYQNGLMEFYRGEVIGEELCSGLLVATQDPIERLKLSHLMQLETETKAWLRPHMIHAGLSVTEPMEWREYTQKLVARLAPLEWSDMIKSLAAAGPELATQYGAYAEAARSRGHPAEAAVCDFMVDHEAAISEFFEFELEKAELATSIEPLMRQSRYPLPVG
jgi:hypothetical protein